MSENKKFQRHANLVDRMANAQGIDLSEAEQRGDLDPTELEQAVFTCLGCSETEACERWLALNNGTADAPPGYCRNEELFAHLRDAEDSD